MSVNQDVFNALLDMGIDAPLARAASARFGAADAAVNWCFSDAGASWTAEDDKKEQVPEYATPGATVTHHEVYDQSGQSSMSNSPNPFHSPSKQTPQQGPGAPPPMPPRRANLATLPSNNPFRNNPPPPDVNVVDDDEDEDLRKALAMSRGDIADETAAQGKDGEDEGRRERERSVRASGVPPPSPEGDDLSKGVVFGPTEKNDPEGKMSLVPGTPGPVNNISKEDEELNRAIQDSLMTASFHSASAAQDADKPVQGVRQPGAPQVLYSQSGSSTYAANYLQGLMAIPQFREAIIASQYTERGDAKLYTNLMNLQSLIEQQKSDFADFIEIDQTLRELRNGAEPNQLPPANPAVEFHQQMAVFTDEVLSTARTTGAFDDSLASAAYIDDPTALFTSKVISAPVDRPTYLNVYRGGEPSSRQLLGAFAGIMWGADHPNAAIEAFSDIIMIRLGWEWSAPKELWQLEERVVLDRFTRENGKRSFQIRADQAVASGEARRVKEKIEKLSNHNGESTLESLRVLVKHYENTPTSDDEIQEESRREMKDKLAALLVDIEAHKAALDEQLSKHEAAQSPAAFDSVDPELNRHVYLLRAVLFHDGITVPGQHLYAYIRHEDGTWWKVQEHKATQVNFETMAGDRTGLFMDGGPYMLLYSREGPRPAPPVPSVDEAPVEPTPSVPPAIAPTTSQDTVKPDEDDLMSFDETPPNEPEVPKSEP